MKNIVHENTCSPNVKHIFRSSMAWVLTSTIVSLFIWPLAATARSYAPWELDILNACAAEIDKSIQKTRALGNITGTRDQYLGSLDTTFGNMKAWTRHDLDGLLRDASHERYRPAPSYEERICVIRRRIQQLDNPGLVRSNQSVVSQPSSSQLDDRDLQKQEAEARRAAERQAKREREQTEREEAARVEAERLEAERVEAERIRALHFEALIQQHNLDELAKSEKYKKHLKSLEASHCLQPLPTGESSYGGFRNSCPFKVNVSFCNFHPVKGSSSAAFDCNNPRGIGANSVPANGRNTLHTNHTEETYWAACKDPGYPMDVEVVIGEGLRHRCR